MTPNPTPQTRREILGKIGHTPGPWRIMNSHKAGFVNIYTTHECNSAVDSVATDWICEIGPGARDGQSEASCNAALIASAPALLAVAQAAEALHAANQREAGVVAMGCYWSALEDALNAWRAAK